MGFCFPNGQFLPGFRFAPTDEELALFYLKRKVLGKRLFNDVIKEVDVYKFWPSDLSSKASTFFKKELKWYFFCPRGKKYGRGERTNRATDGGYWKSTGKDRVVNYRNRPVAKVKTLVFHAGKPPNGERTNWVIHEYRLDDNNLAKRGIAQDSFVLCEIFQKPGWGPQNGVQYGAPFAEEEWENVDDVLVVGANHHQVMEATAAVNNQNDSVLTNCNMETAVSLENQSDSSAGYRNSGSENLVLVSHPFSSELICAAVDNQSDSAMTNAKHPEFVVSLGNQSNSSALTGCNSGSGDLAVFPCPSTSKQVCSEIVSGVGDWGPAQTAQGDSASKDIIMEEDEIFRMLNEFFVDAPLHSPSIPGRLWSEQDKYVGMDLSDLP